MNSAVIGFGSNIDPEDNIAQAKQVIHQKFHVLAESRFIRTKPVGYLNQDDFINGSVLIETALDQDALKEQLKAIEHQLGRTVSNIQCGPRTIDLDIVVFNNVVVDPDFYDRDFLKKSVLELLPTLKY